MAGKKSVKTSLKESLSLQVKAQQFFSYADYFNRVPLFISLLLSNSSAETAENIDIVIENAGGFLLPFTKHLDAMPYESSVEIETSSIVSPLYLTELSEIREESVLIRVLHGKDTVAECSVQVTVLPFDYWSGRSGNAELLASFVRPKVADCLRILGDAREQLKKWNTDCEWRGYQEGDKNKIRLIAAAVYAAAKSRSSKNRRRNTITTNLSPSGISQRS